MHRADADQRYRDFYAADDPARVGRSDMPEQHEITVGWLERLQIGSGAVVLELGCGTGALSGVHSGYVGLDFSLPALRRFPEPRPRAHGDMQRLPFRSNCADFVFSWAALEHVPHPEIALEEIARVLRPGGVALLAPAWHVRPWAAKALPVRSYAELPLMDRVRKFLIPLRENFLWRGASSAPFRLVREMRILAGGLLPFQYKRLEPNLTSYDYTDSDAFTSMDPHAVATYFVSRGWDVLSHPRLLDRLLSRHGAVVVRRPSS